MAVPAAYPEQSQAVTALANEGTARAAKVVGIVGTVLIIVPVVLLFTLGGLARVTFPFFDR